MDVATPFPRHFHVLFDVALCLLKLSILKVSPPTKMESPSYLSPFSTHVFRRRWRNFSPAKKIFSCSFVPSAKGQTEDENFQRLDQQNKYLQRRMNVKKKFLCRNFSPAVAK